jgi:hypothetical protein
VTCELTSCVYYCISRWLIREREFVSTRGVVGLFESFFEMSVRRKFRLGLTNLDLIFVGGSSMVERFVDRVKLSSEMVLSQKP